MDGRSHEILGKCILERCNLDINYTPWSVVPDDDIHKFNGVLHRFYRHRFSTIKYSFTEHEELLENDKVAIALMITSHYWLDMFNAPIFCWGVWWPSAKMSPQIVDEIKQDKNFKLIEDKPEDVQEYFYKKSEKLFNDYIPEMNINEAFSFLIGDLARNTPKAKSNSAIKHISTFTNVDINYTPDTFVLRTAGVYYLFLDKFLQEY